MNFTTDLPKKNPIVSYIVASAVKCEKFFPESAKDGPVFRMHAVILTRKSLLPQSHPANNPTDLPANRLNPESNDTSVARQSNSINCSNKSTALGGGTAKPGRDFINDLGVSP